MWAYESVFYQIYPLGFCGAPFENDGILTHRILKVNDWIEHIKNLGANAIYFSPVFESDTHGYNTRNYKKIDCRLGTNDDFKEVCKNLHKNNIKVVLDGVFNHVGRGFWAFQDVLQNRENSRYRDWFFIDFNGNSNYNDGLWYEGWEGNFDLVKINLRNEEVINHIFECIKLWIDEFDIDGLRLDVAYCLDKDFLKRLRSYTDSLKNDFLLLGELLHGDYNQFVNDDMLHSCTNYECYKGIYSSHNDHNYFEIAHSIKRLNDICRGRRLYTFVDNHDVARIASKLQNKAHLPLVTILLYTVYGIPSVYYGSEFGIEGQKEQGSDWNLRPALSLADYADAYENNEITKLCRKLGQLKKEYAELTNGTYQELILTNRQFAFGRILDGKECISALNCDDAQASFEIPLCCQNATAKELLDQEAVLYEVTDRQTLKVTLPANTGTVFYVE